MNTIDARGLSCPQPVLLAIRAMEREDAGFEVLVDAEAALENVSRAATKMGWECSVAKREGEESILRLAKKPNQA